MPGIKVLIIDNHPVVREGLIAMLSSYRDIDIVGICSDASEALEFINKVSPGIVLMDIMLGQINGIEAIRKISAGPAGIKVIILTVFENAELVRLSIQAGASGYMLKNVSREKLVESIRRVYNGEIVIDPALLNQIVTDYVRLAHCSLIPPCNQAVSGYMGLTPRENDLLRYVAQGLTNKEISVRTHLAVDTVKTHLRKIYRKLGVMNRSQALSKIVNKIPLEKYN